MKINLILITVVLIAIFSTSVSAQDARKLNPRNFLGINFAPIVVQNTNIPYQLIYKRNFGNFNLRAGAHYLSYNKEETIPGIFMNDSMRLFTGIEQQKFRTGIFAGYEILHRSDKFAVRMGADISAGIIKQHSALYTEFVTYTMDTVFNMLRLSSFQRIENSYKAKGWEIGVLPFIGLQYELSGRIDLSASFMAFLYLKDLEIESKTSGLLENSYSISNFEFVFGPPVSELTLFYKF